LLRLFCPRISEAISILPAVRRELVGAGSRVPLCTGLRIELVPIVERGLFGYELVPDRKIHTYVTIGCDGTGAPTLRKTLYGDGARNALQLVTADGRAASRDAFTETYGTTHRDTRFADWGAAAESAWAQLLVLFSERPRQPVVIGEHVHQCLDRALSIAHSYLAKWDPFIHFFGAPNEAQLGFALTGTRGGHGELVFQRPDIWMLRWKAPPEAVYESWSVAIPDAEAASDERLHSA
jgi:hypothetical protein